MKAVLVHISGRVQGVGYRAWTEAEARRLGLDGWVRNRRDGSVEALLSGPDAVVDEMLQSLWAGPSMSRVETIATEPANRPVRPGFEVLPTA